MEETRMVSTIFNRWDTSFNSDRQLETALLSFAENFSSVQHMQYPQPQNIAVWNTTFDLQISEQEENLHHIVSPHFSSRSDAAVSKDILSKDIPSNREQCTNSSQTYNGFKTLHNWTDTEYNSNDFIATGSHIHSMHLVLTDI